DEVLLLSDGQIALLEAFADQAVIAIENARLFQELEQRTAQLTRSVDELEALSEVSQVVSSSLDLQEVLTTIVSYAVRLSGADGGTVYELDEAAGHFELRAGYQLPEELLASIQQDRARPTDDTIVGRATRLRRAEQIPDLLAEPDVAGSSVQAALRRDRLLRDAPGGARRPWSDRSRPGRGEDQRGGTAPARADQRHSGPLQDRGRQDGAFRRAGRGGRAGSRRHDDGRSADREEC